ncbi:MAG: hypothetical protein WDO12_06760 [Pseudomonadota bacterium]
MSQQESKPPIGPQAGISKTAIWVAAARAVGAREPDPAVRNPDHLAERLLGDQASLVLDHPAGPRARPGLRHGDTGHRNREHAARDDRALALHRPGARTCGQHAASRST